MDSGHFSKRTLRSNRDDIDFQICPGENWDEWLISLLIHQACIRKPLVFACDSGINQEEEYEKIDLTTPYYSEDPECLTLQQVTNRALMSWEGVITKAGLYVSQGIKQLLSIFFCPFKTFIAVIKLTPAINRSKFANFERCCEKRFQESFPSNQLQENGEFIDSWFSESKFLRELKSNPELSNRLCIFPEISENGEKEFRGINQLSARSNLWPRIRTAMLKADAGCHPLI